MASAQWQGGAIGLSNASSAFFEIDARPKPDLDFSHFRCGLSGVSTGSNGDDTSHLLLRIHPVRAVIERQQTCIGVVSAPALSAASSLMPTLHRPNQRAGRAIRPPDRDAFL